MAGHPSRFPVSNNILRELLAMTSRRLHPIENIRAFLDDIGVQNGTIRNLNMSVLGQLGRLNDLDLLRWLIQSSNSEQWMRQYRTRLGTDGARSGRRDFSVMEEDLEGLWALQLQLKSWLKKFISTGSVISSAVPETSAGITNFPMLLLPPNPPGVLSFFAALKTAGSSATPKTVHQNFYEIVMPENERRHPAEVWVDVLKAAAAETSPAFFHALALNFLAGPARAFSLCERAVIIECTREICAFYYDRLFHEAYLKTSKDVLEFHHKAYPEVVQKHAHLLTGLPISVFHASHLPLPSAPGAKMLRPLRHDSTLKDLDARLDAITRSFLVLNQLVQPKKPSPMEGMKPQARASLKKVLGLTGEALIPEGTPRAPVTDLQARFARAFSRQDESKEDDISRRPSPSEKDDSDSSPSAGAGRK